MIVYKPVSAEYAAGFFDADGGICSQRLVYGNGSETYVMKAVIANNDRNLLENVQASFGGTIGADVQFSALTRERW